MALSLRIIDSPKGEIITKWDVMFPINGGTIGRRTGTTLTLNDARRIVSSVHAEISLCESGYKITDLSTNGLFINRSLNALGKNKSVILNDGDVLTVGDYVLLVSVDGESNKKNTQKISKDDVFDPFANNVVFDSEVENIFDNNDQNKTVNNSQDEFPDPFLNLQKNGNDDPFITATNYDFEKNVDTTVVLEPKDNILDDELSFEIRPDPFANISTVENKIEPPTPKSLSLDGKNMFGGNPFNRKNELIDTPLGDISDSYNQENNFIQMNLVLRRQQNLLEKALDIAINRFLDELEPENFEEFYSVFNKSRFFFLKPNYWASYKKYFAVNKKNSEWKNKFMMYFHEAIESLKNKNV